MADFEKRHIAQVIHDKIKRHQDAVLANNPNTIAGYLIELKQSIEIAESLGSPRPQKLQDEIDAGKEYLRQQLAKRHK